MISIVIPTNKPVEFVKATIESLASTTVPVEVLVVVDEIEQYLSIRARVPAAMGQGHPAIGETDLGLGPLPEAGRGPSNQDRGGQSTVLVRSPRPGSAIAAWNQGLRVSRGEHLLIGADDLRFHPGALEAALEAHARILGGYGVIGLNDLHHDGSHHTTHFLYDRRFCQEKLGGVMAYPVYTFYCNDPEIIGRATNAGAYYWCKEAIVEHLHPSNNKRPIVGDEARRVESFVNDVATFEERKAAGFPDDFERVI